MENFSRVKKYEELRKKIEEDTDVDASEEIKSEELSSFANKLNNIDPSNFKKMDVAEDKKEHLPERDRRESYFEDSNEEPLPNFKNEYLDDFIKEVKEYNIANGNCNDEDTQINILNQLQNVNRVSRGAYQEKMSKEQQTIDEMPTTVDVDIASQVKELAALSDDSDTIDEIQNGMRDDLTDERILEKQQAVQMQQAQQKQATQIQQMQQNQQMQEMQQQMAEENSTDKSRGTGMFILPKEEGSVVSSSNYRMEESKIQQKLVEETQQLRVQISEYEDEMNGMSDHLDKNSKLLTTILLILIFALVAVIGFVIYMVVKSGGKL
ncbi:MAG: hypothetical protein RR929_04495 [Erysipelotrichaceae bacterium]